MSIVVGFTGVAGAGKDTAAQVLKEISPMMNWNVRSFADPIKQMLVVGLGLTHSQLNDRGLKEQPIELFNVSPRHLMQQLGTEWGRSIDPDMWVKVMRIRCMIGNTLIPDVRFPNEASMVREAGVLVHIKGRGGIAGNHLSEAGITVASGDVVIENDRDIEYLTLQLKILYGVIMDYVDREQAGWKPSFV